MKAKRARGVVVTLPDEEPKGFYADEAKKRQRQKQKKAIARAEATHAGEIRFAVESELARFSEMTLRRCVSAVMPE